jgi:dinuclear metal center YbgI/SA1388 family protein
VTTIGAIYSFLDGFAPFARQMSWDNSGLLVGSPEDEVGRVVLALDATGPVVEEAAQKGAQLILSHHPVIFHPLKKVERGTPVYEAIRLGVGILCAHTNLDLAEGGVNDALAEMLSLQKLQPFENSQENYVKIVVFTPEAEAGKVAKAMGDAGAGALGAYSHCSFSGSGVGAFLPLEGASPCIGQVGRLEQVKETRVEMILPRGKISAVAAAMKAAHPYEVPAYDLFENQAVQETVSLGRIGELETAVSPREFAQFVKERLQGGVRLVEGNRPVKRVAVCGGSGGDLVELAARLGADALVTGDVKHDQLLTAQSLGLTLVDGGHHATEAPVLTKLQEKLQEAFPGVEFLLAQAGKDPAKTL